MPTVVFNPNFGPEIVTDHGGSKLNSPPVYLVFWGSYWQQDGSLLASALVRETRSLLSGPYLSGLQQYHADGHAQLAKLVFDTSSPRNGFSENQLRDVFNNQIDNDALPESDDTATAPIYVVLTPPNVQSSKGNGTFGYHGTDIDYDFPFDFDHVPYAWVGGFGSTFARQLDSYMGTMSHEIAEAVTDSRIDLSWDQGITTRQPGFFNQQGSSEIGDWEPDGSTYTYRINGSVSVQPYWSRLDQAFIVPDGNRQNFYLSPLWDGQLFLGKYALTVNGDQLANHDDIITLDTSGGAVKVTLNGEVAQFDPGVITGITVNTGGGTNTVNVCHTLATAPVTIHGGGNDTVNVGVNRNTQGIQGSVSIDNVPNHTALNVDDSVDAAARTIHLTDGAIVGLTPAPIFWNQRDLRYLNVHGGSGGNTFVVQNTPFNNSLGAPTWLFTGLGNDRVYVHGTTGALYVDGSAGHDWVYLGNSGSAQGLQGFVSVANTGGSTQLIVDDMADTTGRQATLSRSGADGYVDGLAPARLYWHGTTTATGGVDNVCLYGGSGGNVFVVNDTTPLATDTFLNTGAGNDRVYVHGTTGALYVDGSAGHDWVYLGNGTSAQGLQGFVSVANTGGSTQLIVDDTADTTGRHATFSRSGTDGYLDGLAPARLYWHGTAGATGGVTGLDVYAGSGGNTFTIFDVPQLYGATSLHTGSHDTVHGRAASGVLFVNGRRWPS